MNKADKMLTLYFSGTGNTAYVAKMLSQKMGAKCLSIESDADFATEISAHDTIAVCYPIYGSRVPLIMRQFAARHTSALAGKKLVILVTQVAFSGDGARAFTCLFPKGHFDVIYADHFAMPNNVSNFALLFPVSSKKIARYINRAENKANRIHLDISKGIIKRRGFSVFARFLGGIQGKPWPAIEKRAQKRLKIHENCTTCGLCIAACPMKNLEISSGTLIHKNNCTLCYRCVNLCPHRAISVFLKSKPKWQYKGINHNL